MPEIPEIPEIPDANEFRDLMKRRSYEMMLEYSPDLYAAMPADHAAPFDAGVAAGVAACLEWIAENLEIGNR